MKKYKSEMNAEKYVFFVKGLKLPPSERDDPIEQMIEPYYWHNESFLMASPSFTGKVKAFLNIYDELESDRKIIVSDASYEGYKTTKIEDVNPDAYEYIIYDNLIPKVLGKAHVSIFMDYENIDFDRTDPSGYRKKLLELVPSSLTIICLPPRQRKVSFMFGTDDRVKHIVLQQIDNEPGTIAFSKKEVNLSIKNVSFVNRIGDRIKCRKIIFYDILLDALQAALQRIDNIVIIYTKNDIKILGDAVNLMKKYKQDVPDFIKRLIEKSSTT